MKIADFNHTPLMTAVLYKGKRHELVDKDRVNHMAYIRDPKVSRGFVLKTRCSEIELARTKIK